MNPLLKKTPQPGTMPGVQFQASVLRAIFDGIPASVFAVDRDFCYLAFNSRHVGGMLSLYGAQIEIGQSFLNYISVDEDRQTARAAIQRCMAGEQLVQVFHLGEPSRSQGWYEIRHTPIRDENEAVIGVGVVAQDVTEKVTAAEEGKRSAALYPTLFESISSVILIFDIQTLAILEANPAACAFYGYTHDELTSLNISDLNLANSEELQSRLHSALNGDTNQKGMRHRLANGEVRDIDFFTGTFNFNGRPAMLSVVHDVTDRSRAEQALSESEERYRLMFENSQEAVLLSSPDGQVHASNPVATRMFGWSAEEFQRLGRNAIVDTQDPRLERALAERARTGQFSGELTLIRKDGSKFPVEISSNLFTDRNGNLRSSMFIHDISGRRQAEEALRASEQNMRSLLETMAEGIALNEIVYDGNGEIADYRILNVNRAFYSIADFTGQPVIGSLASRLYGMTSGYIMEFWKENLSKEKTILTEMLSPLNKRWFLVSTSPVVDNKFVTTFLDITERKQMELALRASEAQYRTLIDVLPAGVFLHRDGIILLSNQACARYFGAESPEQLAGTPLMDRIHPDFRETVASRIEQVEKEDKLAPWLEEKLLRMDGSAFDGEVAAMQVIYQGQPATLAVYNDISARKQAGQALRESEERYRRLVETSPDIIYRFSNRRGGIYYSNRVEQIFGWTPAEMVAQPLLWHDSIHPDDLPGVDRVIANFPEGSTFTIEYRIHDRQGTWHWLQDRRIGSVMEGGEIIVEGLATDISARKQAELELQAAHAGLEQRVQERTADLLAANQALEKLSRAKDEFLSTMSHELRTPLTGILGLAQVLLYNTYGELNEKQTRAIQNIEKSGQHLHELINDILDISRLQNGKIVLELQPCSLHNICLASLQMVSNLAAARRQETLLSFTPENIILKADERRIRQIIINLLGNAIKFTPEGGRIELSVNGRPEEAQVYISVKDNGIGIKPEDVARLFQPFSQLDSSLSRQYTGTGLGLSLVKNLAELHGGRVELESSPGQGSCFTIILPWLP